MDTRTGDLYPEQAAALKAGVPRDDLVEVSGTEKAIRRLRRKVRMMSKTKPEKMKAKRRSERAARRRNRKA